MAYLIYVSCLAGHDETCRSADVDYIRLLILPTAFKSAYNEGSCTTRFPRTAQGNYAVT